MTDPEFEEQLEEYRPHTHAIFRSTLGEDAAPDAVQELFCRKWRARHSYNPQLSQFKTWLSRNAHHLCVDIWRKSPQHKELEVVSLTSNTDDDTLSDYLDTSPSFTEQTDWKIALRFALDTLTLEEKIAVFAREIDRYTWQETAILMGKTVSEVRTLSARALKKLRGQLTEQGIEVDED